MILTVTANPALDVTYRVDSLLPGRTHRVTEVLERAGGKGFNVSRVLHERGIPTLAIGPVGGHRGAVLRADLVETGVPHELVEVEASTRMTISVAAAEATMLNEPGHPLCAEDWSRLFALVGRHLSAARVLVCSGSLPPSAPDTTYARLVRLARAAEVRTIVDTSGSALWAAAEAGADVLKPNADELRELLGDNDLMRSAHVLRGVGAREVVVSMGADGLIGVTEDGCFRAAPPFAVAGNPTGAGDAAVAALADGLAREVAWPQRLRTAVAWSAAAVAAPMAGSVDSVLAERIADGVTVTALRPPGKNQAGAALKNDQPTYRDRP
ncbi:MAG: 1-phosphofructokinase family hexose kinase [Actinomycetota bacterium]|nr:1-phosphofructokinase family hexose kinase [Actinomycetota bacterium]